MDKADVTRRILRATVDKAINDIGADPERSVRNLVELGQNFASGRFQQYFFDMMRAILNNGQSAYYPLAEKIVSSVDHETLETFGINIGYNGFTLGAANIRETEDREGYNIPWTAVFRLSGREGGISDTEADEAVSQFRELGVYCYIIICKSGQQERISWIFRKYSDCAFVLFVHGEDLSEGEAEDLTCCKNLMVCISADSAGFAASAVMMRRKKLLYGVYSVYSDKMADDILSGLWLRRVAPETGTFAFLVAGGDAGALTQSLVRDYVHRVRREQRYPLFLMDMTSDIMYIDKIISDDACSVMFDEDGQLMTPGGRTQGDGLNLRCTAIKEILRAAVPKKK
ncbi:MAG: hypothetical protein EOM54_12480 [Clostridia bacterium]|nr:hypothetical protein [Clostridia bacterium]